jgi:hypothetical protein
MEFASMWQLRALRVHLVMLGIMSTDFKKQLVARVAETNVLTQMSVKPNSFVAPAGACAWTEQPSVL